jgi:hypothetical protein
MSRRPMRGGCGRRTGDEEAETAARRTACTLPLDIGVVVASKWRSVASPQAKAAGGPRHLRRRADLNRRAWRRGPSEQGRRRVQHRRGLPRCVTKPKHHERRMPAVGPHGAYVVCG